MANGTARIHGVFVALPRGLFSFGNNFAGQLGLGYVTTKRSSPVQVGSDVDWSFLGGGRLTSLCLRSGALFSWGSNSYGQLGLNNTTSYSSPVQVGGATDWTWVGSTEYCGFGIRGGKLYGWGRNQSGEVGDGSRTQRQSPVLIGAATDWTRVGRNGQGTIAAIRGGALFAWGSNDFGELGNSDYTVAKVSSPVQVGAETDWTDIALVSSTCAGIRSGKLFTWGSGSAGLMGIGDPGSASYSSPVQVGAETDWTTITGGYAHFLGIRSGKLFVWGNNAYGELGLGDLTQRSSPVQVGSETDWTAISGGDGYSAGIRGGKLFVWGQNDQGQLGQGDISSRSSPVQVGSASNWNFVAASVSFGAYGYTLAAK